MIIRDVTITEINNMQTDHNLSSLAKFRQNNEGRPNTWSRFIFVSSASSGITFYRQWEVLHGSCLSVDVIPRLSTSRHPCATLGLYSWSRSSWVEQGLTSHQTHYRSYRGQVLWVKRPNQQCQWRKHWRKRGPKDQASMPLGPPHCDDDNTTYMQYEKKTQNTHR